MASPLVYGSKLFADWVTGNDRKIFTIGGVIWFSGKASGTYEAGVGWMEGIDMVQADGSLGRITLLEKEE